MTLSAGTRLGPYEILSPLGAGGMGEVWRARDDKLGRDVAIKVLPVAFAQDAERLSRFRREAQVLASLNHTHIAAIYGLEESGGLEALVLELVEGETLGERMARGLLPVEEALSIARQIAEALEAAHEQGIVHRDLKPANIKLGAGDRVKVLDFGLAKALDPGTFSSSPDLTRSPTITLGTQAGVILGTAAYMSPEQARGRSVDKRADIWAFGVVLFEMLTGRRVFEGETVSDTLAAVLKTEPAWSALPAEVPARIRELVARCLQKDPHQRLHDMGDARIEIEQALAGGGETVPAGPVAAAVAEPSWSWRRRLPWALVAVLALATAWLGWRSLRERPGGVVRASISPPEGTNFWLESNGPGPAVVSPDGRQIAFTASDVGGKVSLYVRSLDASEARALSGTEGAQYPFWSPDSRSLGFFAAGKLKTIEAAGAPPLTLCAVVEGKGGSWSPAGVIVFTPNATTPLFKVSDKGGEASAVTRIDQKRGEDSHRHPRFLPDGRHFLYLARLVSGGSEGHAVMVGSVDGGADKLLLHSRVQAEYASGRLLFLRDTTLMARPFDPARLVFTGDAVPVAERILVPALQTAVGVFSASQNGVLIYQTMRGELTSKLQWFTRDGKTQSALGDPAGYGQAAISPDGKQVAAAIQDPAAGTFDLWILETSRGVRTRFTFDPAEDRSPVWSSDGKSVIFSSNRKGHYDLYRKPIGGTTEEEPLLVSGSDKYPVVCTRDGRFLVYLEETKDTLMDIGVLPLAGDPKPESFLKTKFNEIPNDLSPDGRWLLYTSDESGQWQVYVTSFPRAGRKWQVSITGGAYSFWRGDGKEIVYQDMAGQLTAVPVASQGDTIEVGGAQQLFHVSGPSPGGPRFWPAPDHQRFLAVNEGQQANPLLDLVVRWTEPLRGVRAQ